MKVIRYGIDDFPLLGAGILCFINQHVINAIIKPVSDPVPDFTARQQNGTFVNLVIKIDKPPLLLHRFIKRQDSFTNLEQMKGILQNLQGIRFFKCRYHFQGKVCQEVCRVRNFIGHMDGGNSFSGGILGCKKRLAYRLERFFHVFGFDEHLQGSCQIKICCFFTR